jgi:hypothetical protein
MEGEGIDEKVTKWGDIESPIRLLIGLGARFYQLIYIRILTHFE